MNEKNKVTGKKFCKIQEYFSFHNIIRFFISKLMYIYLHNFLLLLFYSGALATLKKSSKKLKEEQKNKNFVQNSFICNIFCYVFRSFACFLWLHVYIITVHCILQYVCRTIKAVETNNSLKHSVTFSQGLRTN